MSYYSIYSNPSLCFYVLLSLVAGEKLADTSASFSAASLGRNCVSRLPVIIANSYRQYTDCCLQKLPNLTLVDRFISPSFDVATPRKKTQGKKTQKFRNSRIKLKLKPKSALFGIFIEKNLKDGRLHFFFEICPKNIKIYYLYHKLKIKN